MPVVQIALDYWILLIAMTLHGLGILFIFDVIMHGRTSQGTIAWVMALFFFPYLAVFLYLMFGARRIHKHAVVHQSGSADIHRLGRELRQDQRLREVMVSCRPLFVSC